MSKEAGAEHTEVAGLPPSATQVALTESGGFALYVNGTVWSWGMRANRQLGRETSSSLPARVETPAAIAGLPPIAMLAAGHGHVLAVGRNGTVWSWGANSAGQLGTGSLGERTMPAKVSLPAHIKTVAAWDTHSFAVDDMGRLWGWGSNNFGQTGEALTSKLAAAYFIKPQRIKTGFPVAFIDAGMFYTVATSAQGEVFAWGWNGMGQIGQEGVAFSAQPLRVKPLRNVTRLAVGVGHTLALNDAGLFAWGDNRSSACGAFPSTAVQVKPRAVSFA